MSPRPLAGTALLQPPFSPFDPPADLPDDLKAVFHRAADPVLIAMGFCSDPERFDYSLEQLSSSSQPLQSACNQLGDWMRDHEAQLRAEAPEVHSALEGILGVVVHLSVRLGSLVARLGARPGDPNNPDLVALVNALRENSTRNRVQLAHALLDGIAVSGDVLTELRSALSVWAVSRDTSARDRKQDGTPEKATKHPRASVNARMMETIQTNIEAMGWNSRQWSDHLKCSKPAVVGTQTWEDLKMARERKRAERIVEGRRDRRRKPKASDRRKASERDD
jgi:hypothetical protein